MKIQNRRWSIAIFGRIREHSQWTADRFGFTQIRITWTDREGKVRLTDHVPREDAIKFHEELTTAIERSTHGRRRR